MYIQAINLTVKNIGRSIQYYKKVLDFTEEFSHGNDDGTLMYASLKRGEIQVMLSSQDRAPEAASPTAGAGIDVMLFVKDDDIDQIYTEVKQNGGQIAAEIEDKFWGHREFIVEDLDGFRLVFTKHVENVDFSHLESDSWGSDS